MSSSHRHMAAVLAIAWKEFREIALILSVGLLWLVLSCLAVKALDLDRTSPGTASGPHDPTGGGERVLTYQEQQEMQMKERVVRWIIVIAAALQFGAAAMVGAGTFAQEREGMTETYLDSLAAARRLVWCAKLAARGLLLAFVCVCATVPVVGFGLEGIVKWELYQKPVLFLLVASAFAVCFLASTLMSSPLDAVATGFVLWLLPFFVLAQIHRGDSWRDMFGWTSTLVVYGLVALLALSLSFLVYVKRYRPV